MSSQALPFLNQALDKMDQKTDSSEGLAYLPGPKDKRLMGNGEKLIYSGSAGCN